MDMKKKIVMFSLVLFFTTLCASLFAHTGNIKSIFDHSSKHEISQQSNNQTQSEVYAFSDIQDETDFDDLDKVKFDYSIIAQSYISYFFKTYSFYTQPTSTQNCIYFAVPRYILYHSLQVASH